MADRDCIKEFIEKASTKKLLTKQQVDAIQQQSVKDVAAAVKFAQDSPEPEDELLYEDVFAN